MSFEFVHLKLAYIETLLEMFQEIVLVVYHQWSKETISYVMKATLHTVSDNRDRKLFIALNL